MSRSGYRVRRFICCLFDAHRLRYDGPSDWMVCEDCGEVRVTEREFSFLAERSGR